MVRLPISCLTLALVAGAPTLHAQMNGKARAAPLTQDDRFLAAREAFRVGQYAKVAEQAPNLKGYVLEPYVEYYLLRMKLEEVPATDVRDVLSRQQGTYIADQLRRDWLKVLAKRQIWDGFESEYSAVVGDDPELACYALQARWRRGDQPALDEFRRVWAVPRELPEGCVPLAESEIAAGKLTTRNVWDRVRMLLEAGQVAAAKRAINYLPANETPDERTLDGIRQKPANFIERADKLDLKKRMNRELLLYAFARAARGDPELGAQPLVAQTPGAAPARGSGVGLGADRNAGRAERHLPGALEWYAKADGATLSEEQLEWWVRAALRDENWVTVRAVVEKMPPLQRTEPAWTYWRARALRAAGDKDSAEALSRASPASRSSTASSPPRSSAGAYNCRRVPRRQPWRRWPRSRRTPGCSARWRCIAWTCASKACGNGIGRSAAWTIVHCSRQQSWRATTRCGTAQSIPPTARLCCTITRCATRRRTPRC